MKTNLSHLLPVWQACEILGEPTVDRIVHSLYVLRHPQQDDDAIIRDQVDALVQGLLYRTADTTSRSRSTASTSTTTTDSTDKASSSPSSPPLSVAQAWNSLLKRNMALDKHSFFKFAVPTVAQPHIGAGGHMGLFDCWVYALAGRQTTNTSSAVAPMAANSIILLPDIIIVLAICKQYHTQHDTSTHKQQTTLHNMAAWAFRLYDAYQKRGTLTRDTIHRFLSDVHGDDSYKTTEWKTLLDHIFQQENNNTTQHYNATLSAPVFCKRIVESTQHKHKLLDWIATLGMAMLPLPQLPPSSIRYLKRILDTGTERNVPKFLQHVGLHESRLYEIKRRFHSLTQTNTGNTTNKLQHAIGWDSFCNAVTENYDHGPFLTKALAKRLFLVGCSQPHARILEPPTQQQQQQQDQTRRPLEDSSSSSSTASSTHSAPSSWAFWDVLKFAGTAVRKDERALLELAFDVFAHSEETHPEEEFWKDDNDDETTDKILNRQQIGTMLLLLLEQAHFRLVADSPPQLDDTEKTPTTPVAKSNSAANLTQTEWIEQEILVDVAAASLLGLLPADASKKGLAVRTSKTTGTHEIPLHTLIDVVLDECSGTDTMTLDDFCQWQSAQTTPSVLQSSQVRLGPFLMELRLMAAVLFGVPPKRASLELELVEEVDRRHKFRYPRTETSRRGPRGTTWYIIDFKWFQLWRAYCEQMANTDQDSVDGRDKPTASTDTPRKLGRISNRGLLAENGSLALRPDIRWRHDYDIVPPLAWSALQAWYDGGPPIHRTVVPYISTGAPNPHARNNRMRTEHEIELYPFFVTIFMCDAASRGQARPFQQYVPVSRTSPVRVILVQLCKELDVDPKFGRLWMVETNESEDGAAEPRDWLLMLDESILEQRNRRDPDHGSTAITLLLELKDEETGLWPRGTDGREWAFLDKTVPEREESEIGDGIVGLHNMGNTCYLNSSMQCISHTPIFRDYFTSKAYLNDINTTNPLGHQGRLAQVSAVLINTLWKKTYNQSASLTKRVTAPGTHEYVDAPALTPKTFKESLGKFNDHFAGNEQHDAQELLAFLLGGLSEDLNRIVDKPYIEAPDSDGRPDHELADIWWSNHLKREMSIIVALFTGQYKSLLTCRSCKYESARFEPFSFLQLPLPEDDHISVTLILYPLREGAETLRYSVRVRNDGKLLDVLMALAKVLHLDETLEEEGDENSQAGENSESSGDEGGQTDLDEIHRRKAQNLAVVDMREGYIFKIAPNSWALSDLQNKETGELPLLHVYELEPLPESDVPITGLASIGGSDLKGDDIPVKKLNIGQTTAEEEKAIDEDSDISGSETPAKADVKYSFVAVCQRRAEVISRDLLHPLSHRVFGTPLLQRIVDLEGYSGRDIYDLVAHRLRNVVPKAALPFLEDRSEPYEEEETETREEGQPRLGSRARLKQTLSDMEEVAAGPVPRYGFRLRLTSRDGRRCALCSWHECCIGCLVPDDNYPTVVMCGDSVAVDWHFAVDVATSGFGLQDPPALRTPRMAVKNHSSCGTSGKKKGYSGNITLEDCLDAFAQEEKIPEAYCSRCRDFRVQTKRMSLWRLPPVVIIHLKRFQFTTQMRRKLRDLVVFPLEGLDLSRIMASSDMELPEDYGVDPLQRSGEDHQQNGGDPMQNGSNDGRSVMLYDLYGVVHHQGALSGGHYVASLKSEIDGQWRLFNDAQIYEIHSRDVVDSSAYILFYIRRDVVNKNLSDFWTAREGEGLTEEEMNNLIRNRSDRCVIS